MAPTRTLRGGRQGVEAEQGGGWRVKGARTAVDLVQALAVVAAAEVHRVRPRSLAHERDLCTDVSTRTEGLVWEATHRQDMALRTRSRTLSCA